jgi:hypothetical protein
MAAFEMALGGYASQGLGLQLPVSGLGDTAAEVRLYSEAPGFLLEVGKASLPPLLELFERAGVDTTIMGRTLAEPRFRVLDGGRTLVDLDMAEAARLHGDGLRPYVE